MEIQTSKSSLKLIGFLFCISFPLFISCKNINEKKEFDLNSIEERQKAIELAYEYEQFVNKIWHDLDAISDSLTELQLNREGFTPPTRLSKMASIEQKLELLNAKLKDAEKNRKYNRIDKQKIHELRDAIAHKDMVIKDLTNQIVVLKSENTLLGNQLKEANQSLEEQYNKLEVQLAEQKRLQNALLLQTASNYENTGDVLRKAVFEIGGYKGNGILKDVKQAQLDMLDECLNCYNKAYNLVPTESLKNKIILTRRGVIEYQNSKSVEGLNF